MLKPAINYVDQLNKLKSIIFDNEDKYKYYINNNYINFELFDIGNNDYGKIQQATGTKYWIDFDLDIDKNWKVYDEIVLKEWMKKKGILTYCWIDTKSGYHLLVYKEDIKFNPSELTDFIRQGYGNWLFYEYDYETAKEKLNSCEIIKNDNSMIPLVGCWQGDHIVRVINKEKFNG